MQTPDLRELAEAATDNLPRSTEAEALASLREFALGPMEAVLTWSEAGIVLELVETLTKGGIIEVAIRNPSVAEYMQHWEGRAEKAEAANAALLDERDALRAANEKLNRLATDRAYFMEAYRNMLGPDGLRVAAMWDERNVQRVHYSWGPKAFELTGEERARTILDAEESRKSAVLVRFDDNTPVPASGPDEVAQ